MLAIWFQAYGSALGRKDPCSSKKPSNGTTVHPEQEWVLQSPSSELESERDIDRRSEIDINTLAGLRCDVTWRAAVGNLAFWTATRAF